MTAPPYIVLAIVLILAVMAAVTASAQEPPADSSLPPASVHALDPDQELTPAQEEALRLRDEQALEEATAAGESHVPAVVGEATEPTSAPEPADTDEEEIRYGAPADDLVIHTPTEVVGPAYGDYGAPTARPGQDLGDLLATLIREWSREPEIQQLSYSGAAAAAPVTETSAIAAPPVPSAVAAIRAGAALYARTLYEVNSDYPGPVLVEILEEPLAGAVASGSFQVIRDRIVLRLTTLEHEGTVTAIDGWAVDLDCACFGVDGEVDRHWFERVILPAAISFAEAWATALARPDRTVTVEGDVIVERTRQAAADDRIYEGLAAATGQVGRVLTEDAPGAMTVRIPRSTPLAVTLASPLATAEVQQ